MDNNLNDLSTDRREVIQIKDYDKYGNLRGMIIPSYKLRKNFMDKYEIELYKCLLKAIARIRVNYEQNYSIFAQVSLNRIFDVNDMREYRTLFNDIIDRSIDFVIYDNNRDCIHRCIELNGSSHDEKRRKRDNMINEIFRHYQRNLKLIWIPIQDSYDIDELVQKIIF